MKKSLLSIVGLGMLFMACEQKPKKAETVIPVEINSNSIIENDLKNDSEMDTYA